MSQRAIGKFAGVSQGQVANVLGLLKLPDEWEALAISCEIGPTHLRHLARWSHRPAVLEAAAMAVKEEPAEALTVERFREIIAAAAFEQSRAIGQWSTAAPLFEITDARRDELDIEEVENRGGNKDERAFNVPRWEALQKEAKQAEAKKRKAKQKDEAVIGPAAEPEGPREGELLDLWTGWWRGAMAQAFRKTKTLTKDKKAAVPQFAICLCIRHFDFGNELRRVWSGQSTWSTDYDYSRLADVDPKAFVAGLIEHLPAALESDIYWEGDELEIMAPFGPVFGIEPERDWRPEFEWLAVLSVDQLRRLPAAEMVTLETLESLDRTSLIERLLEHWPDRAGIPEVFRLPEAD